ncbi:MAG TPA: alpha/beta hydrolase [Polyangiaceae bacterium]
MKPLVERLRPRGALAWAFAALGAVALLAALGVTLTMLWLVDYDGIGRLGVFGLMFAPQLVVVALVALGVAIFARRKRALLAASAFGATFALLSVMGAWPTVAQRAYAAESGATVSAASAFVPEISGYAAGESVTYAVAPDGKGLLLDVWRARGAPEGKLRPAIVKVHGGGWNHGSRGEGAKWTELFTALGYEVFDIDYRKPPPERWRDEVADVKCAIGWVSANAVKYSVDPSRISVMGYSAGANLAMLAAFSMGNPMLPPSCPVDPVAIRAVVNFYGPSRMNKLYATTGSRRYVHAMMHAYIGGDPETYSGRYDLLSPFRHVTRRSPPTITLHGEADRVVPAAQARLLHEAFEDAGAHHEIYLFPWADHGFDVIWGSFATQTAREKIRAFLGKFG